MIKNSLKSSFVLLIAVFICHTAHGSPIDSASSSSSTTNRQANDEINQVASLDLKRISNGSTTRANEESSSTRDELDGVASANLLSVLGDLDGSTEDLDGVHRQLLQPDSSHLLAMNLLPGKRRFDDNTALASTGQARGNRFIMPGAQMGAFRPQQLQFNSYINEALLDHPKLDAPSSGHPKMVANSQRRASPAAAMPLAERRQLDIRPRGSLRNNGQAPIPNYSNQANIQQQNRAYGLQESVKRPARPLGDPENESEQDSEQPIKDSDIFKDEADELKGADRGGAEKRAAGGGEPAQVDYDDNDDGDEVDQREQDVVLNARASASKLLQERQQFNKPTATSKAAAGNPMQGIEDSASSAGEGAQDEDIDSSNLEAKKSGANALGEAREAIGGGNLEDDARQPQAKADEDSRELGAQGMGDAEDEALAASQLDKSATDLQTAAGHHHGHSHGHYYQYAGVPKKKAWKFGFKRGNHKHTIAREEKGYKNKFHSSFKWHAKEKCKKHKKCESVGKMSWHYEHHDKKKHHHY